MAGHLIKFKNEKTRETVQTVMYSISIIAGIIALVTMVSL